MCIRDRLDQADSLSLAKLTPAHLDLLAHLEDGRIGADAFESLVVGGEALNGGQLRLWRERRPGLRIFNEYGPTETVVGCCVHEVGQDPGQGATPIGAPIANTQLHVLDPELRQVPVGAAGELHIAGEGLARGYLGRPGLTADRFIANPFGQPGQRMYRTGDRVRRLPDGQLEFLGRLDDQIKLRGHRIELGEIEAALQTHPAVAQAAVALRPGAADEPTLTAYLVERDREEAPLPIALSLFFFADAATPGADGDYGLLFDVARAADDGDFEAIWIPERHFTGLAGAFSAPAALCAALAVTTKHLSLRAGSIVLPLHDPLRVAEEWATVDVLSGGRVGLSFAPGWVPDDFVFAPDAYQTRRDVMMRDLDVVRKLWRGEAVRRRNGLGADAEIRSFPRPVSVDLPTWVTATQTPETFVAAGRAGANVLTALLSLNLEELAERIALYKAARAEVGLDPEGGRVTLMLHTFIGRDDAEAKAVSAPALAEYFRAHADLRARVFSELQASELIYDENPEVLVERVVERYLSSSALIGGPERCAAMLQRVVDLGVDEVACLVDFGVDRSAILDMLPRLASVRSARRSRLSDAELVSHLSRHLPRHMTPGAFVHLDAMPTTPSGKLDRSALPTPALAVVAERVSPRTPLEEMLCGIWADVLRRDSVGATDNFFTLGGHSLAAIRIITRVKSELSVDVPLRLFFERGTVEGIAEHFLTEVLRAQ